MSSRTADVVAADPDQTASSFGRALVDLLLTVGYIDGVFHERERAFVQDYLARIRGSARAEVAQGIGVGNQRIVEDERGDFDELFDSLDHELAGYAAEVLASSHATYAPTRLKVRALTIFGGMSATQQEHALELVRALIRADGTITSQEHGLYEEMSTYFAAASTTAQLIAAANAAPPPPPPPPPPISASPHAQTLVGNESPAGRPRRETAVEKARRDMGLPPLEQLPSTKPVIVAPVGWLELTSTSHPLLDALEHTFSPHPAELHAQLAHDFQLGTHAVAAWSRLRQHAAGRLAGVADIAQIPLGQRFLDGQVHVLRPARPLELVVLGDLHGCYGCFKAALLQSRFIERAWAHQWDPERHPEVKLVLLGDYIDRGRFSFDGVLRAVLQLFVTMPEQVIVLRGNHEHFVSAPAGVFSAVQPAEALASLSPHVPREMLEAYRVVFEHMPTSLIVDRTLFVHAGIPREDSFAERYRDLSSLNDLELIFQMLWSDPVQLDHVPVKLQRQNPRFSFGRKQFTEFMMRAGFHTLIRGHERIDAGFEVTYQLGDRSLLNLFSAGGWDNVDLPVDGSYRSVTPMALTIQHPGAGGTPTATPWPIHYQAFNHDTHNGFHRPLPTLRFREI